MKYNSKKEVMSALKRDIEYAQDKLSRCAQMPLDEINQYFEFDGTWTRAYTDLQYTLPFNKAKYVPMIEKWCEENGYKILRTYQCVWDETRTLENKPAAGLFFSCVDIGNSKLAFEFALRTGLDGDKCQLNAIGKKEVSVYEVTCGES
jgi:hypothetical protein